MSERQFNDRVVMVTGAATGIGRTTALTFAQQGAKIIIDDVDAGGEDTVAAITATDGHARFVESGISQAALVQALVDTI